MNIEEKEYEEERLYRDFQETSEKYMQQLDSLQENANKQAFVLYESASQKLFHKLGLTRKSFMERSNKYIRYASCALKKLEY